jgi:hypothetical protein
VHSLQYHLIITLSLADRRDWRDTRGKWPLARNPVRSWWHCHTSLKLFWPQPMDPWTTGSQLRGDMWSACRISSRYWLSRPELSLQISSYINSSQCWVTMIPYSDQKIFPTKNWTSAASHSTSSKEYALNCVTKGIYGKNCNKQYTSIENSLFIPCF